MPPESAAPGADPLAGFTAPTRAWFARTFGAPTTAQTQAWHQIAAGNHTLVIAPTGSGKTLAAFLTAIDSFVTRPSTGATRVLYVSPLKALGVDVERNLTQPLEGIARAARSLAAPDHPSPPPDDDAPAAAAFRPPTTAIRSGDTTPQQRRRLLSHPADILITTPESLYLMLTSQAARTLARVETVILDEVHAVAGTKRGAHLALSLERLDALLPRPAQRIGLSATVTPPQEVARFVGGARPAVVVAPTQPKRWELTVRVPVPDMAHLPETPDGQKGSIWPHVAEQILQLVTAARSTIVFVNGRRTAERLTARLNELAAGIFPHPVPQPAQVIGGGDYTYGARPDLARTHHGSISKEERAATEAALKEGRLRCVVATSSLELGIDMGDVDQVIQVQAPPTTAAALQRVGRAGHQVGAASVGAFFPLNRSELLPTALTVQRMRTGDIEELAVPRNPLDVLAQQTVAAAAARSPLPVEEWWRAVRRAAPFADLPREAFDSVLDMLAGRYPSTAFANLRPRLVWDRAVGLLTARPGAQRLAVTSGGTIPDRGLFGVFLSDDDAAARAPRRVGELDEEMVYESRVGDVIVLGASTWRIEEIGRDRVVVSPAPGQPGRLPFWHGDGPGRPAALGAALGALQRELASRGADPTAPQAREAAADLAGAGLDANAVTNTLAYLTEQREATGVVPSDTDLVVESFPDELGDWYTVLLSPYGTPVHAPWALAVGARISEHYGVDPSVLAADDGIVLRLPASLQPPGAELFVFHPEEIEQIVTAQLGSSVLFAARFRECASRALLLPRPDPGKRAPLWQQRLRASQLLEVARDFPDFPIVLETVRECLNDVYDLPALTALLDRLARREVRLREVTTSAASPFAGALLFGYTGEFLYNSDAPLAERRAAVLQLDPERLARLLGRDAVAESLDPEVVAAVERALQHLDHPLRGIEGAADLLRELGPLTAAELAARLAGDNPFADDGASRLPQDATRALAEQLVAAGRAVGVDVVGEDGFAAVEDTAWAPVELVRRYAATHGPFPAARAAQRLGLAVGVVEQAAEELAARGEVHHLGEQWCDARVLERIRRRSLTAARAQIQPVDAAAYARFLARWQGVGGSETGPDAVAEVLAQLAGVAAPASAWETFILPARVPGYQAAWLDEVLARGDALYTGAGRLGTDDGWIAFHLPGEESAAEGFEPSQAELQVLEQLAGGARFGRELEAPDAQTVDAVLLELLWAGQVTNDTFAPVRHVAAGAGTAHKPRHRVAPRAVRVGRLHGVGAGPRLLPGRWSSLPRREADATAAALARAEVLLDRFGVVTRGVSDSAPGGFAALYQVLARMEERGIVRRGYFVAGLGGAQFAVPAAVEELRAAAGGAPHDSAARAGGDRPVVLAATDPANPYGAALPWPDHPSGHRPGRKAGGLVVLVDGELALYLERGGRTALGFPALRDTASVAAALVAALRRARVERLALETLDGAPIAGTPLAAALVAAGCYPTPRGVRFRS